MNHFKTSLSYYWYEESFSMRRFINGIFYFLRKIPLVGKHIPVSIYKNYELKKIIFILVFIGNVLLKFGAKFLWYGISAAVAVFLNSMFDWDVSGLVCWFFLTPLIWRFFEGFMQMLDKNQLSFVQNFQLSPKIFIEMTQSVDLFSHVIAYIPVWLLFTFLSNGSIWLPLSLLAGYVGFAWFFYYMNRFLITMSLMVRSMLGWTYVLLVLAGLGVFSWQVPGATQLALFGHPLFALAMIVFATVSYRLLFNFPGEEVYVNKLMLKSADFDVKYSTASQTTNTYLGEGLKMQKEMTLDEKDYTYLKGGHYLNAVLFSRYRKTLNKQLLRRLIGILAAAVLVIGLLKFIPNQGLNESLVLKLLPILFFAMYGLTFGKKVVQLVFINCDSSMLYYPFYRERQTILQGFMYRFWQTFKLNGILSLALFVGFLGLHVVHGFFLSGSFFLVLVFLLTSLSFLFSFHELFVYYILQPFTSDLDVVNPVYKFVNVAFYWVAYMNLQIRASGFVYVVGLATVSLIYVVVGLIIIFMIAPKTFRFKG